MRGLNGISLTDFLDVDAALDRRLELHSDAPIALALSGGGDSLALLHLAQRWARRHGRRVLAVTVDHGLHADSAAWTAFAGEAARASGADWRALQWSGRKPATGLPAAARSARHRLLADAARDAGVSVILFAHTRDDVAEGDLMRASTTPTLGRLRDWSPSPIWPEGRGVFALRPLLDIGRAALRAWLRAEGLEWLDDPANADPRFARTHARNALASAPPDAGRPIQIGHDPELMRLAAAADHTADGRIQIDRPALMRADTASARRFLSIAALCASGQSAPPRTARLDHLLDRLRTEAGFVTTLTGARISADPSLLVFAREAGDIGRSGLEPLALKKGGAAVWDGRFEIEADADIVLAPLAGSAARLSKADRARAAAFPATARPSLPLILHGGGAHLPRPFGDGPAHARPLAAARFATACGLIAHERDISPPRAAWAIAQNDQSSYVEALALG